MNSLLNPKREHLTRARLDSALGSARVMALQGEVVLQGVQSTSRSGGGLSSGAPRSTPGLILDLATKPDGELVAGGGEFERLLDVGSLAACSCLCRDVLENDVGRQRHVTWWAI